MFTQAFWPRKSLPNASFARLQLQLKPLLEQYSTTELAGLWLPMSFGIVLPGSAGSFVLFEFVGLGRVEKSLKNISKLHGNFS